MKLSFVALTFWIILVLTIFFTQPITAKTLESGKPKKQQNIIFIVTDQERYPPTHEHPKLTEYRKTYFRSRNYLTRHGISFKNHYISSSACTPSRSIIYTGHHLNMHGVDSTTGIAKNFETDAKSLKPGWLPTLGDYMKAAGYETKYVGKWHLSEEDITTQKGVRLDVESTGLEEKYEAADKLKKFGFGGWKGPEPHGGLYRDSGFKRDPLYTKQAVDILKNFNRTAASDSKPFFLAVNLVNPHDMVFFQMGLWKQFLEPSNDFCPHKEISMPPSFYKDLTDENKVPDSYRQYVHSVTNFFFPKRRYFYTWEQELCFYYFLMHKVDKNIWDILQVLEESSFSDNTVVVLTSDHGELAGSHGKGIEKWHNAYEETVHVPFLVSGKKIAKIKNRKNSGIEIADKITSHLDIVPTMIGLTGHSEKVLLERIHSGNHGKFEEIQDLPGTDVFVNVAKNTKFNEDQQSSNLAYFYTRDNVFYADPIGLFSLSGYKLTILVFGKFIADELSKIINFRYDPPWTHNSIEAVIFNHESTKYKFIRHFDDANQWMNPSQNHTQKILGNSRSVLKKFGLGIQGDILERSTPFADFYEVFDLTSDTNEMENLSDDDDLVELGLKKLVIAKGRFLKDSKNKIPDAKGESLEKKEPIVLSVTSDMMPPGFLRVKCFVYMSLAGFWGSYFVGWKLVIDRLW